MCLRDNFIIWSFRFECHIATLYLMVIYNGSLQLGLSSREGRKIGISVGDELETI